MAKGTETKQRIFEEIINRFPGAFWETTDKILRIPAEENGETIEIKVQLVCAKNILDGQATTQTKTKTKTAKTTKTIETKDIISEQEKDTIESFLNKIGR